MSKTFLTTRDLPEDQRVAACSAVLRANVFPGHLEAGAAPFEASIAVSRIGPLACFETQTTPTLFHHAAEHETPVPGQRVILQTILSGEARYYERSMGEWTMGAGGLPLAVGDSTMDTGFFCEKPVRMASVAIPRALLVPRFARMEDFRSGIALAPSAWLLRALVSDAACGNLGFVRQRTIVQAFGALLALAIDEVGSDKMGEQASSRARLAVIRDYLADQFDDPSLSPAAVAARFGISTRYLHKLMEATGRSFRGELLMLRLEAAFGSLRDASAANRTIADIAYASGFNDLSQFNRGFRARFGTSPRAVRAGVRSAPHS